MMSRQSSSNRLAAMLGKSAQILAERGADPKAMSFVTTGIELLAKQLRDYADGKDLEDGAEKELDSLCKMLDIQRANGGAAPSA